MILIWHAIVLYTITDELLNMCFFSLVLFTSSFLCIFKYIITLSELCNTWVIQLQFFCFVAKLDLKRITKLRYLFILSVVLYLLLMWILLLCFCFISHHVLNLNIICIFDYYYKYKFPLKIRLQRQQYYIKQKPKLFYFIVFKNNISKMKLEIYI